MTFRPEPDDLPLHPVIVRWLAEYARAPDAERDDVVARMFTELNALLHRAGPPEHGRVPPSESEPA